MQKGYLFMICFFILGLILSSKESYAQEERFPRIGYIKTDRTNIRAGDNLNFEVLCQASKGDRVKVLEKRYGWYKILLPKNASVFIKKEFVNSDDGIGIVNANNVNVRARPSTNFTIIGQLNKDDKIKILEEIEGWYKIQPENFTGWVHSDLITFSPLDIQHPSVTMQTEKQSEVEKKGKKKALEEEGEALETIEAIEEKTETQKLFTAKGTLLGTGRVINRPGTHKLVLDTKTFYYLKSEKVNLDRFVNSKVEVKGKLVENKGKKANLVIVETIEIIK